LLKHNTVLHYMVQYFLYAEITVSEKRRFTNLCQVTSLSKMMNNYERPGKNSSRKKEQYRSVSFQKPIASLC
jgi:hypothetical protein